MRIRTQLAIALFALAVIPLAGIVSYSYWTSRQAVEQALQAESAAMSEQLTRRLSTVRGDLRDRLEALGALPFDSVATLAQDPGAPPPPGWLEQVAAVMGESAGLVGSVEVHSHPPAFPKPPPAPESDPPEPPSPPGASDPVLVIDLPALIRLGMEGALEATPEALREVQNELAEARAQIARERVAAAHRRHPPEAKVPGAPERSGGASALGPPPPRAPRAPSPAAESLARAAEEMALRMSQETLRIVEEATRELAASSSGHPELAERIRSVVAVRESSLRERESMASVDELLVEISREGEPATELRAAVRHDQLLRRVLGGPKGPEDEVVFAVEGDGTLHLADPESAARLGDLPRLTAVAAQRQDQGQGQVAGVVGDWVIVTTRDPETGIAFGVARPLREPLQALRRTAVRNFGWGLLLVSLALLGILPLATHLTRDLAQVTAGAERIAAGDLEARVPVRSSSEVGVLAATFNRMAQDLAENQERLVQQRLLELELARRAEELEEARQLQLSLLPRVVPQLPSLAVAVSMRTATEVGGDYYDFQTGDGALTVAIGDATGHGAQAGTMVTVLKGLFSAWPGGKDLAGFLTLADSALRRMDLGRMLMAFALVRVEGTRVTVTSAGMPPVLVWRHRSREVEEVDLPGLPLGANLGNGYRQQSLDPLNAGDALLLMSDGLAELRDPAGEPFGYSRIRERLGELGDRSPEEILSGLVATAEEWAGDRPAEDDLTFVALRLGGSSASPEP